MKYCPSDKRTQTIGGVWELIVAALLKTDYTEFQALYGQHAVTTNKANWVTSEGAWRIYVKGIQYSFILCTKWDVMGVFCISKQFNTVADPKRVYEESNMDRMLKRMIFSEIFQERCQLE